jgi:conjugative transposon TraM protein
MKKINFKQPKYIFPLVILLPLLFLAYIISNFWGDGSNTAKHGVVTDSINMNLPDAAHEDMGDKMSEMNRRMAEDGAYTAVTGIGEDKEEKDSTGSGYSESELNAIDKANADKIREQKEVEEMERSLAESRKHINSYSAAGNGRGHSGGSSSKYGRSQSDDFDDYAAEIDAIQRRSAARQKALAGTLDDADTASEGHSSRKSESLKGKKKTTDKSEEKAAVVEKVQSAGADKFHTVGSEEAMDEPLIKAMIDKTTKAHEGTRLRFKLLDDVTIKGMKLKKGTYLYGIVTGFGQQRVMASITSILVRDKFIKVSLSVFDNDGMEGFYVPESAFRDMMKDAGSQAMQQNIQLSSDYGGGLSGEAIALQALQNMYQSASNAVAGNIRKNKARIKYNTIVYLINTGNN